MNTVEFGYDEKNDELELVVEMSADSWVALGLKNKEAAAKCNGASNNAQKDNTLTDDSLINRVSSGLNIRKIVDKEEKDNKGAKSKEF